MGLLSGVEILAYPVGKGGDSLDASAELFSAVGLYPPLAQGVRGTAFEEGFPTPP